MRDNALFEGLANGLTRGTMDTVKQERDTLGMAWLIGYTGIVVLASVLLLAFQMWSAAFLALALAAGMLAVTVHRARKS